MSDKFSRRQYKRASVHYVNVLTLHVNMRPTKTKMADRRHFEKETFWKKVKSPYLSNRSSERFWRILPNTEDRPLKYRIFENPRWWGHITRQATWCDCMSLRAASSSFNAGQCPKRITSHDDLKRTMQCIAQGKVPNIYNFREHISRTAHFLCVLPMTTA